MKAHSVYALYGERENGTFFVSGLLLLRENEIPLCLMKWRESSVDMWEGASPLHLLLRLYLHERNRKHVLRAATARGLFLYTLCAVCVRENEWIFTFPRPSFFLSLLLPCLMLNYLTDRQIQTESWGRKNIREAAHTQRREEENAISRLPSVARYT